METHVAATYPGGHDIPISTLLWGAVMVVALFVACLLAGKAIAWVRDRSSSEDVGDVTDEPMNPWDKAVSRPSSDFSGFSGYYGDESGDLVGMNQREQEELFSIYAPRKVRKVMRARKRERERRRPH